MNLTNKGSKPIKPGKCSMSPFECAVWQVRYSLARDAYLSALGSVSLMWKKRADEQFDMACARGFAPDPELGVVQALFKLIELDPELNTQEVESMTGVNQEYIRKVLGRWRNQ